MMINYNSPMFLHTDPGHYNSRGSRPSVYSQEAKETNVSRHDLPTRRGVVLALCG